MFVFAFLFLFIIRLKFPSHKSISYLFFRLITMPPPRRKQEETDEETRIAIVNTEKCKPKRCRQECKKSCPVVRIGKLCIEVMSTDKKANISEELCIGCGICVKKCPFDAIMIIKLPSNLQKETVHR